MKCLICNKLIIFDKYPYLNGFKHSDCNEGDKLIKEEHIPLNNSGKVLYDLMDNGTKMLEECSKKYDFGLKLNGYNEHFKENSNHYHNMLNNYVKDSMDHTINPQNKLNPDLKLLMPIFFDMLAYHLSETNRK